MADLASRIRAVPDFPAPGIVFRDVMPLLADADGFAEAIEALAAPWRGMALQAVVGMEARGFIFGAALAQALGVGFVPLRKPGKLPGPLHEVEYGLEYGRDRLQVQADALAAAAKLLQALQVEIVGATVLVEIEALGGRARCAFAQTLVAVLRF